MKKIMVTVMTMMLLSRNKNIVAGGISFVPECYGRLTKAYKVEKVGVENALKKFKEKTDCPILVNTSFNVRGEPIVNTPEDAFNCFMGTELDKLVIGNCYLDKKKQKTSLKRNYKENFELD